MGLIDRSLGGGKSEKRQVLLPQAPKSPLCLGRRTDIEDLSALKRTLPGIELSSELN